MEEKNVPQLRFHENKGECSYSEWETKKLKNICTFFSGGTPDVSNSSYYNGEIPFIKSGEINKNKTVCFITEKGLQESSAKLVSNGDLLYALYGATSGEVGIAKLNGAINQAVLCIRSKSLNINFMKFFLIRKKTDIISKYLQGGQGNLSADIIKSLELSIPSLPEQTKIANFFSTLDSIIEKKQEKIKALEEQKKGYLQKIFSQELRFKGDEGEIYPEWETKALKDVLVQGSKKKVENTSKHEKITVKLNLKGVEKSNIKREMADTRPFYIRKENEIIIGKQNYFNGSVAIIPKELDGCICSNVIMSFSVKTDNHLFIYHYISQRDYIKEREQYANGTGQKELSESDFLNFEIRTPILEEQTKIANFFSVFDSVIEREKDELTLWKVIKKGLMQQMFI